MSNKLRSIKREAGTTEVELSPIPPELKGDVDAVTAYINNFLDSRFPNGIQGDMRVILFEMVLDAYTDGMKAQAAYQPEESFIIQP